MKRELRNYVRLKARGRRSWYRAYGTDTSDLRYFVINYKQGGERCDTLPSLLHLSLSPKILYETTIIIVVSYSAPGGCARFCKVFIMLRMNKIGACNVKIQVFLTLHNYAAATCCVSADEMIRWLYSNIG
jgi:hypothetical protein